MKSNGILLVLFVLLLGALLLSDRLASQSKSTQPSTTGRQEIVFWHFWGGADRDVVNQVVQRFNESQKEYFVRAIPMPGNNLQAKLFLAIAGGDPPDLVNQDDPIVGDWGWRGIIQPIQGVCSEAELQALDDHLFPAARKLGTYGGELYGVCNGLDIRALYYNQTALRERGFGPPQNIDDLNAIALSFCPAGVQQPQAFGYLPDARRLWAWGQVFGGDFYDASQKQVRLNQPPLEAATEWMAQYARWYGSDTINRFRQGDQSLPGKTFPLLPVSDEQVLGRYALVMDGQWRVRDITAFTERRRALGLPCPEFGVCSLPPPPGGRRDAGWVNGNFFVIPKNAKTPKGAVAFIKFWIGLENPSEAAATCAAGGWVPVSQRVVDTTLFQQYLKRQPLFREFVRLAASESQVPVPVIPGAPMFKREVEKAAAQAMSRPNQSMAELLQKTSAVIQGRLDRLSRRSPETNSGGRRP